MLILFLVLLLSITRESLEIYCVYSDEPFEWSLDEFNFAEFKEKIDAFTVYDYEGYEGYEDYNDQMCRVEIYIDYKSNRLIVSFGDSFQWSELDHQELRLDSLIIFDENNTEAEYYHILEYACSNYDQCNRQAVFYHIHWLTTINFMIFQTHLTSLFTDKNNQTG